MEGEGTLVFIPGKEGLLAQFSFIWKEKEPSSSYLERRGS
jgi:hypothetical protein